LCERYLPGKPCLREKNKNNFLQNNHLNTTSKKALRWLLEKCFGDQDNALAYCAKSVQIRPVTGKFPVMIMASEIKWAFRENTISSTANAKKKPVVMVCEMANSLLSPLRIACSFTQREFVSTSEGFFILIYSEWSLTFTLTNESMIYWKKLKYSPVLAGRSRY
jgi:hypothetical protein